MKYLKILGLAAIAAMALTAFAASSAGATSLEVGGVKQEGKVALSASIETGTSAVLSRTDGTLANTCTVSNVAGETESGFTTTPTGAISSLTFEECTRPVTVHKPGKLYVEYEVIKHIVKHENGVETVVAETKTDGTVFSEEAEVTVSTPFGTVNCKTGAGTRIGILTGVKEGNATMDINAVLNCGFLLPSASWRGAYTMTGANAALGVTP